MVPAINGGSVILADKVTGHPSYRKAIRDPFGGRAGFVQDLFGMRSRDVRGWFGSETRRSQNQTAALVCVCVRVCVCVFREVW